VESVIAFSDAARALVEDSRHQAGLFRHAYVGTEHLLIAMVASDDSSLAGLFRRAGVDLESVRRLTSKLLGTPRADMNTDQLVEARHFTIRSKSVIEYAMREAMGSGRDTVTAVDLLLGLLTEGEGVGVAVLADLKVDLDRIRALLSESDAV
jgi:ATP-dependent Clp protease ATP-binding subunit ClpC